ncbi:MAG: S9 family peptidase [Cyclobacteriaceae bacterium]
MKQLGYFLGLLISINSFGQRPNQSVLSIDEIMQGENYIGYLPTEISWSDDSQNIYFSWNPDKDTLRTTYKVEINSTEINKLSFEELKDKTNPGEYTKDYRWKVYEKNGDLFLIDNTTFKLSQITSTIAKESKPIFSGDEKYILYQKNNNLFKWHIEDGSITQLTDFRKGTEKVEKKEAQAEWLERDQLNYFDILKKRNEESDAKKYRDKRAKAKEIKTVYLAGKGLSEITISPDLKFVVYRVSTKSKSINTIVPDYTTQSGYTKDLIARPKVGHPQDTFENWILNLETDSTYQIQTKEIEGIYDKPAYKKEYSSDSTYSDKYDRPREVTIEMPTFSDDGKAVVNITSQDYKDRWIMSLDLPSGKLKLIDRQHDDAWIAGYGIGWFSNPKIEWLDNENIWYKSEESGYTHLYTANVLTGESKALTKGKFEVIDVNLSKNKKTFYIMSNKEGPHEHHFYHMNVTGGKMKQITSLKGGHEVTVSPDEEQLAIRYSYSNKPWELYVMPNEAGAKMTQLTRSTTKEFEQYKWMDPEIVHFKARDGENVPATLYRPNEEKNNGAAIIFVHGAGYLQNVHYWWPQYFREYMFHNLLVDNGYTVLAIDFRASQGYGRDWRTAIYRHMGGKDLNDQIDGAKYLVEKHGVSKNRIGIYGGSYGGFITLMAMFKYPDTFKSGAALRSVTDWAHYNHGYTGNILNTPVEDSVAYARSSPIYFAEGLKGKLLMLHGMIDTNVQFQDVVRLSQRLIELKKENWELAVFPLEGHGFIESTSWSDEYRRIFKLFQNTLLE